eukprot:gene10367-biopygen18286
MGRRLVQLCDDGLGPSPSSFLASGWRKRWWGTGNSLSRRDANRRRARAPGPQMIWMAPGSSLAFQRKSLDTTNCILSVRFAETIFFCRLRDSFVTDSQGVPDDVRGNRTVARAWRGHGAGVARAIGHFWLGVAQAFPVPPGVWGGGGYIASHALVEEQHHTIAGAMMCTPFRCARLSASSGIQGALGHAAQIAGNAVHLRTASNGKPHPPARDDAAEPPRGGSTIPLRRDETRTHGPQQPIAALRQRDPGVTVRNCTLHHRPVLGTGTRRSD